MVRSSESLLLRALYKIIVDADPCACRGSGCNAKGLATSAGRRVGHPTQLGIGTGITLTRYDWW